MERLESGFEVGTQDGRAGGAPGIPPGLGRVLVIGASRSGQAAAQALLAQGLQVTLSDSRSLEELERVGELQGLAGRARVLAGPQAKDQLQGVDLVVKSPGVPGEIPLVQAARALGLPVWSEIELAYRLLRNPFTAITGTNGKTTTTALIGHLFATAGRAAHVAGNIGTAAASLVGRTGPEDEVVVEVSSFQLEDVDLFRPAAAVFLNLTPDHLDRHFTLERYLSCKGRLFSNQGPGDAAVINLGDPAGARLAAGLAGVGGPKVVGFSTSGPGAGLSAYLAGDRLSFEGHGQVELASLQLKGTHNYENCLAAGAAALARGLPFAAVADGLRSFAGVPHRLQRAGTVAGVAYVNDSKATNVEAALKALDAYPRGTHLILGGKDKASDYRPLARKCRGTCRAVYLIGQAAPLIREAFAEVHLEAAEGQGRPAAGSERETGASAPPADPPLLDCGDLEGAMNEAARRARPGEVVLLAPACASFDQYRDFEERGEHFMALARSLGAR
jgi:UDP-N-acetylmuramoylalanine--D-glutamate ligase